MAFGPLLFTPACGSDSGSQTDADADEVDFDIDDGASKGESASAVASPKKKTEIKLSTGAKVTVPPGAVDKEVTLGLKRPSDKEARELVKTLPASQKLVSAPYVLTPHGTKFKADVKVTLPINKEADRSKLAVVWLEDENDKDWAFLGKPDRVGTKEVDIDVKHFSVLLLVEMDEVPAPGDGDGMGPDTGDGDSPIGDGDGQGSGDGDVTGDGDGPGDGDGTGDGDGPGDGDGTGDGDAESPLPVSEALYISNGHGVIQRFQMSDLSRVGTGSIETGLNGDLVLREEGCGTGSYLLHTGDGLGARFLYDPLARTASEVTLDPESVDRSVGSLGAQPPSGRAVIPLKNGLIAVSDANTNRVLIYSETAGASAAPVSSLAPSPDASPWGLAYMSVTDTLFVAQSDGSVAVYELPVGAAGTNKTEPDRTFYSDFRYAARSSFRGLAYDSRSDNLFVSDVGAVDGSESLDFASDGSVLVFTNPRIASGEVSPRSWFGGNMTGLGNPVSIHLVHYSGTGELGYPAGLSDTLFVADEANDTVWQFTDIYNLTGNVVPSHSVGITQPRGLTGPRYAGNGWNCGGPQPNVAVLRNPSYLEAPGSGESVAISLFQGFNPYSGVGAFLAQSEAQLQGIDADPYGNVVVSFGHLTNPGIAFINGSRLGNGTFDPSVWDRELSGPATGLAVPGDVARHGETRGRARGLRGRRGSG